VTTKLCLGEAVDPLSKQPFEPHPLLREGHLQTIAGWAWPRRFGLSTRRAHLREEEHMLRGAGLGE
jgi:hypothetical protein